MLFFSKVLAAGLLLAVCGSVSAQTFEGQIVMQKYAATGEEIVQEVVFTIKGQMVQLELDSEAGPTRVIKDLGKGTTTSLFEKKGKKFAFTASDDPAREETEIDPRHAMMVDVARKQVKFEITEETRQIGGYQCVKINASNHREQIEAWVTNDLDISLIDYFPYKQQEEVAGLDVQKMIWDSGFVVEFWTKDKSTKEVKKITFTPVERRISDKAFTFNTEEYRAFDENVLNDLYVGAANDAEKMAELRELLEVFQTQ